MRNRITILPGGVDGIGGGIKIDAYLLPAVDSDRTSHLFANKQNKLEEPAGDLKFQQDEFQKHIKDMLKLKLRKDFNSKESMDDKVEK